MLYGFGRHEQGLAGDLALVGEARRLLIQEEAAKLIDMDEVTTEGGTSLVPPVERIAVVPQLHQHAVALAPNNAEYLGTLGERLLAALRIPGS